LTNGILDSDLFKNSALNASAVGRIVSQAGVGGVVQELTGGKFLDGLTQGALNGLAGEISTQLNLKIKGNADLSASERSTLELLSRASTSAIRALGNPGDPLAGFASSFLSSLLPQKSDDPLGEFIDDIETQRAAADAAGAAGQKSTEQPDDPLGEFIAENQGEWDRRAAEADAAAAGQDGGDNTTDADAPDAPNNTAKPVPDPVQSGGRTSIAGQISSEQTDDLVRMIAAAQDPTQQISSGVPRTPFGFLATFDGTNNDGTDLGLSDSSLPTNVFNIYDQAKLVQDDTFQTGYYPGVGTGGINGGTLGAGPFPTQYLHNAAEQAYAEFVQQASHYLDGNQGATYNDISASVMGFSRGSITGVIFAQMVNDRGLVLPDGRQIAPPGSIPINGMALLDPVATGVWGDLSLPPNVQGKVLMVTAQEENRSYFRLADYSGDDRVQTIGIPANHCGVGGGYDQNGTAAAVREIATTYLQNSGINIAPVPENQRFDPTTPAPIYTEDYRVHIAANGDVSTTIDSGNKPFQPDIAWSADEGPRRTVPMPVDPSRRK
jgi:hypothetical protein